MSTGEVSGGGSPSWAPPAEWYEQDHRGHVVQFYAEDGFLLEGLSRFIGTALGAGDAAVVVATKAHRDGLAERLRARGFNTASAIRRGRLVLLDAVETLGGALPGLYRRRLSSGEGSGGGRQSAGRSVRRDGCSVVGAGSAGSRFAARTSLERFG
ncbi:MAG: hypothetical protein DMG71_20930 [Acidobacteria bacterium]|nr:MAG: hypothetical protein DMG71_20930 [Acidobacteriota bacterium]